MIPLVLAVLGGLVLIGVVVDWAKARIQLERERAYERDTHQRLLRELRRQP